MGRQRHIEEKLVGNGCTVPDALDGRLHNKGLAGIQGAHNLQVIRLEK